MRAAVSLLVITVLQGTVHADEFDDRLSALSHVFDDLRIDSGVSELGEHFVRWQKSLRDFLGDTAERLAQLSEGANIPDVSILSVEPVESSEASGFGWRDDPIRHRAKFHSGTDFKGKSGTPVLASGPGVVVFAGRRGGYGNQIEIDHGTFGRSKQRSTTPSSRASASARSARPAARPVRTSTSKCASTTAPSTRSPRSQSRR
jgi:murein DD-endopeptidase MepM/ murein hydrolase activator NlpD